MNLYVWACDRRKSKDLSAKGCQGRVKSRLIWDALQCRQGH